MNFYTISQISLLDLALYKFEYKDFFSVLVIKYDLAIEEFSDEEASAAEEALDDTCQV